MRSNGVLESPSDFAITAEPGGLGGHLVMRTNRTSEWKPSSPGIVGQQTLVEPYA
jgi:hypothetical protein